jgi:hypothetical protein
MEVQILAAALAQKIIDTCVKFAEKRVAGHLYTKNPAEVP